jgi:hypothetical protein
MITQQVFSDVKSRLQAEAAYFNGAIPERVALVWDGYIAALLEWGLISVPQYDGLSDLLPKIPDNPVLAIFLRRAEKLP